MNARTVAVGGAAALGAVLTGTLAWWTGVGPPAAKEPSRSSSASPGLTVKPLPAFREAPGFFYQAVAKRDPFESAAVSDEGKSKATSGGMAPDPSRPKEPLEAFDLAALTLVGTVSYGNRHSALMLDDTETLHWVVVGDRLGGHHGRVRRIGDAWVELVELVPNGLGGWVERIATLSPPNGVPQT